MAKCQKGVSRGDQTQTALRLNSMRENGHGDDCVVFQPRRRSPTTVVGCQQHPITPGRLRELAKWCRLACVGRLACVVDSHTIVSAVVNGVNAAVMMVIAIALRRRRALDAWHCSRARVRPRERGWHASAACNERRIN